MADASAAASAASRCDRASAKNWRQICMVAWIDISASKGLNRNTLFHFHIRTMFQFY
jgi:hypothetical protein